LRVQNRIVVQMHPWMLVETTRVTEFEYYFACTRKGVHLYSSKRNIVGLGYSTWVRWVLSTNIRQFNEFEYHFACKP